LTLSDSGRKVVLHPDKTWEYAPDKKASPIAAESSDIILSDATSLRSALESIKDKLVKSDFETAAQYYGRVRSLLSETLNKKTGRPLSETVVMLDGFASYDAEKQKFVFSSFAYKLHQISARDRDDIRIVKTSEGRWFQSDLFGDALSEFAFSMPPDKAQEAKPDLALLVYGLPVEVGYSGVSILPLRYAAYNRRTKEIYAKQDAKANPLD